MELINLIFIIFILLFVIYFSYKLLFSRYIKSNTDNNYYLVRNVENKQQIADTLGEISNRIKKLVNSLNESKDYNKQFYDNIKLLKKRHTTFSLSENIFLNKTSFTLDKQETMLCITTRDSNNKIYDINELMFVALHELCHVGCRDIGHGQEFQLFFKFLLEKSVDIGIYKYIDYSKVPQEYCGIIINDTPLNS